VDDQNPILPIVLIIATLITVFAIVIGKAKSDYKKPMKLESLMVVNIDGCEYFKSKSSDNNYSLCHKGNCTNSFHYTEKLER